jgi:FKBP-type peptidyl-prolyl cis-trans isomerase SlyD
VEIVSIRDSAAEERMHGHPHGPGGHHHHHDHEPN